MPRRDTVPDIVGVDVGLSLTSSGVGAWLAGGGGGACSSSTCSCEGGLSCSVIAVSSVGTSTSSPSFCAGATGAPASRSSELD